MRANATGSPLVAALRSSLACFLYCSTLGRSGRIRLGTRNSFHAAPGMSAQIRLKEDSSNCRKLRWARPFPRTGCALSARTDTNGSQEFASRGLQEINPSPDSLAHEQRGLGIVVVALASPIAA